MLRRLIPVPFAILALAIASEAEAQQPYMIKVPNTEKVSVSQPERSARELIARQLKVGPEVQFGPARTSKSGDLRIYKYSQVFHGMPVAARGASVVVRPDGSVVIATGKVENRLPASAVPSIDAKQAAQAAAAYSRLNAGPEHARLVVWPVPGGSRLVYVVRPPSLWPIPYVPVVVVDAGTGQVMGMVNAVHHLNKANLFEFNPVSTPTPIEVDLPVAPGNTTPDNVDTVSMNCIDTHKTKQVSAMGFNLTVHVCELASKSTDPTSDAYPAEAVADTTNDDFLQYELVDHTSGGDPYAQLSAFYHVNKAYAWFRNFDSSFMLASGSQPLFVVTNLMMPAGYSTMDTTKMADPNLPLEPMSNAMYSGWDPAGTSNYISMIWPEITGGSMIVGQGTTHDFAYDGDVIYHEFGHAVVEVTANLSMYWLLDEQGGNVAPGAMNEGIADYFSSSIAGDPKQGEYAAKDISPSMEAIRDLDNTKSCPTNLVGEVHADSEFFSAPMWKVRAGLATDGERHTFDATLFATLSAVSSGTINYPDLANAFVTALQGSTLGATTSQAMQAAFTTAGILPGCTRMMEYTGTPLKSTDPNVLYSFGAAGKNDFAFGGSLDFAPGVLQFKVPVQSGDQQITATFAELSSGTSYFGGTFQPQLLVKFDAPIAFELEPAFKANTDTRVTLTKTNTKYSGAIPVPTGATTMYVMVINTGTAGSYYTSVDFKGGEIPDAGSDSGGDSAVEASTDDVVTQPDGAQPDTAPQTDAGGDSGVVELPENTVAPADDNGGCGCRAAGGATNSLAGSVAIAALALLAKRRRSRP